MNVEATEVRHVMTTAVVTVGPEDSIQEAALRLSSNRISGMPVVAGRRVVGVISESDIIQALTPPMERERGMTLLDFVMRAREPTQEPRRLALVEDVMSSAVSTIAPTASIWEAASAMHRRGVKRLPVIDDDNRLVGIVSRADLVRAIASVVT